MISNGVEQFPLRVDQLSRHPGLPAVHFTSFSLARRPSAVPHSQGRLPGLTAGIWPPGAWPVERRPERPCRCRRSGLRRHPLVPYTDLVLRVLGLVQRQSQLFHCFHLRVVRVRRDGGRKCPAGPAGTWIPIEMVRDSRPNPCTLFRCGELAYPANALADGHRGTVEPLIGVQYSQPRMSARAR